MEGYRRRHLTPDSRKCTEFLCESHPLAAPRYSQAESSEYINNLDDRENLNLR